MPVPRLGDCVRDGAAEGWRARRRRTRNLPPFARAGAGCVVGWPRTITHPERIELGDGVVLGPGLWLALATARPEQVTQGAVTPQDFDPHLVIGDRVRLGRDVTIGCLGRVEIGADVWGGDRLLITDSFHEYADPRLPVARQPMAPPSPVRIHAGAFLGTGTVVNPGVTIGEGAVVGAGSIVTRSVPAHTYAAGAPARVLRSYA